MTSRFTDPAVYPSSIETPQDEVPSSNVEKPTYGEILKSSTLVGGSSVLNTVIGIVRTKALALLLGPAGFGLFSLYGSIATLAQNIAGVGVNSSGVRQIAVAVGSDDTERIAQTTVVLRRTNVFLGLLGAALLVTFSRQVSVLTFGSPQHAGAIRFLSIAVLFQLISGGQGALIQGMRHIADLAKMSVLGAAFGTLISIPTVYFLREKGVVPSLVAVAATTILTSWWYSRKIRVRAPSMKASQVGREAAALLRLGFAFMSSGLVMVGVSYAVRVIVLHKAGVAAVGDYQVAWTLGGLYVGAILQAMAADFYPRLTANVHDDRACNRLVNEQARVGLLLAGPGVIATLTFASLVIALLYSAKFGAAVEIVRWFCLGTILQVITWPMGFIIMAKGRAGLLIFCEVAWGFVSLGLAWLCVTLFGVNGAGIAFFGSYVFHLFLIYPIVHRLSGFTWSSANKQTGMFFLSLIALVFFGLYILPVLWASIIGTVGAALTGLYSIRVLGKLIPWDEIPQPVRRMLAAIRAFPSPGRQFE